jgi:hypothetical protein
MKITKAKAKVEFCVETSYPAQYYSIEHDEAIEKLAKKFKGERTGAGMGFGYRDNGFSFANEVTRAAFVGALTKAQKTLKVSKCYLSVYIND